MIPPPDCIWKCPKCGSTINSHKEFEEKGQQCLKCGEAMRFIPRLKGGPQSDLPEKKY